MEKIICITSMGKEYYRTVGKMMIESYDRVWPDEIPLYIYSEDELSVEQTDKIKVLNIHKECDPQLTNYLNYIGDHFSRNFTYKVYSWIHAVKNLQADWILWLDADTVCYNKPDKKLFDLLFDNEYQTAYMGTTMYKDKKGWLGKTNCDSAIISFNKKTQDAKRFVDEFERLYETHEINNRELFPKPNDTHAFIHCIEHVSTPSKNLNPKAESLSPLKETVLHDYFRHFKASKKDKNMLASLVDKMIKSAEKLEGTKLAKRIDRVERRHRSSHG